MAVKYIILAVLIVSASAYEHHQHHDQAPAAQSYVAYSTLIQTHAAPVVYSAPVAYTNAAPVVQSYAAPSDFAYTSLPETVVAADNSAYTAPNSRAVSGSLGHGASLLQVYSSPLVSSYTADLHNGLNAVVPNEHAAATAVPNFVSPVAYAAPAAYSTYSAQVSNGAPVASNHGASGIQRYSAPLVSSYTIDHQNGFNGFRAGDNNEHIAAPAIPNDVAPAVYAVPVANTAYAAPSSHSAAVAPVFGAVSV
ncbi:cuticle protein 18.6-like [Diabrotica virgifera virgifera]|uniref:Cuticle protein 18.6-like n=1 Tax=Diabrotica virgifera virgifera TaxID=50390 RepID=A0A6P7FL15_DIAVI|nr:cuticle protein 18.6-like [Diabrotica virgifera virgifera]